MTIDVSFVGARSRFVYTGGDLTLRLPCRPWDRRTATVGGSRTSGGGIPAAYVVRRDYMVVLPLRFMEDEWPGVEALLAWGQGAELITWYPDAADTGTSYEVWLEAPVAGVAVAPTRNEFPGMLELTIELRAAVDVPWELDYYGL
jgi:hypothetical protein